VLLAGVLVGEEIVEQKVVAGGGGHASKLAARAVDDSLSEAAEF
jgi:hypothetical protein